MDPNYSILLSSFSKEELVFGEARCELFDQLPKVGPLACPEVFGAEEGFREIDCSPLTSNYYFKR